jgi:hypothetical protein
LKEVSREEAIAEMKHVLAVDPTVRHDAGRRYCIWVSLSTLLSVYVIYSWFLIHLRILNSSLLPKRPLTLPV